VAETLILDEEAVHAFAFADRRGALRDRARAILTVAHERGALVRVPVPVLSEVCRNPRRDSAGGSDPERSADRSGRSHAADRPACGAPSREGKLSSAHAIDAFVVAFARPFEQPLLATGDPSNIQRLAAPFRHVHALSL